MQVTSRVWIIALLSVFLFCSVSQALTLGTNITIWDGVGDDAKEDDEVEPGCVATQAWDLEGFFLNGSTLTMVGGYDFVNGEGDYASGDIFIDVLGTGLGYDYVLDIDFESDHKTYSVIKLISTQVTTPVFIRANDESDPWKYESGGTSIEGFENLSLIDSENYWSGLHDDEVALLSSWGDNDNDKVGHHYAAAFDLSFLAPNTEFVSHFTMECGNDNLMGRGTAPVPEPATIILMGIGLLGLIGLRRMKR